MPLPRLITNVLIEPALMIGTSFDYVVSDNNNFDFYGLKFGAKEEQIKNLFGTKNYEVLEEDTNYTYRYFDTLENNLTVTLELQVNIEKDILDKFIVSLY